MRRQNVTNYLSGALECANWRPADARHPRVASRQCSRVPAQERSGGADAQGRGERSQLGFLLLAYPCTADAQEAALLRRLRCPVGDGHEPLLELVGLGGRLLRDDGGGGDTTLDRLLFRL